MTLVGRSTSTGCSVAGPRKVGFPCSSTLNVCGVPEIGNKNSCILIIYKL